MSLKPRIAIIIPGGIGTGAGNIGVPVLERQIKDLSVDFDIIVFSLFKVNHDYIPSGDFELISIPSKNFLLKSIDLFVCFRKKNSERNFQLIHGCWALPSGILAVVLAKVYRIKSIVSILGGDAVSLPHIHYGQLRHWYSKHLVLWTLRKANCMTVLTNYLLKNLISGGLNRKDVSVIPWGIDTDLFRFRPLSLSSPVQYLHIANLEPVKDQETLLRAFSLIIKETPGKLTIVGKGSLKSHLTQLIERLGLSPHINLLDPLPYNDLPAFYHQSHILIHTSLSEGQSEVVTEAMSCGAVVCGTSVGLMSDLPSCCIAVPVGDSDQLAKEIIDLVKDPVRWNTIRDNAHAWAHEHSHQWTLEKIRQLYLSI